MADGIVGVAYRERFRTSANGESFTFNPTVTKKPDRSTWTPPIAFEGNGVYVLEFVPDQAGIYSSEFVGNTSGALLGGQIEILAAPSKVFARRRNGQDFDAGHINELQQRLEELPF